MVDFTYPKNNKYICYIDADNIENPILNCQTVNNVLLYAGIAIVVIFLLSKK